MSRLRCYTGKKGPTGHGLLASTRTPDLTVRIGAWSLVARNLSVEKSRWNGR